MKKDELKNILESLKKETPELVINEGIQNDKNTNTYPRIVYFEYLWNDIDSSDEAYTTQVMYQISIFDRKPRNKVLLELKRNLNEKGIRPDFSHEHVEEFNCIHSYMTISVLEEL